MVDGSIDPINKAIAPIGGRRGGGERVTCPSLLASRQPNVEDATHGKVTHRPQRAQFRVGIVTFHGDLQALQMGFSRPHLSIGPYAIRQAATSSAFGSRILRSAYIESSAPAAIDVPQRTPAALRCVSDSTSMRHSRCPQGCLP